MREDRNAVHGIEARVLERQRRRHLAVQEPALQMFTAPRDIVVVDIAPGQNIAAIAPEMASDPSRIQNTSPTSGRGNGYRSVSKRRPLTRNNPSVASFAE